MNKDQMDKYAYELMVKNNLDEAVKNLLLKDKEIEKLNNIINSFEKRIITIKNKCEQILAVAPLDVRINERDKINLLDSVLNYLEELKEGK